MSCYEIRCDKGIISGPEPILYVTLEHWMALPVGCVDNYVLPFKIST